MPYTGQSSQLHGQCEGVLRARHVPPVEGALVVLHAPGAMITFSDLLSRADADLLQQLLGGGAVRLLVALDPELARPQSLRRTLLDLRSPEDMLLDRKTRVLLLELLRPDEARSLCDILSIRIGDDPFAPLLGMDVRRRSNLSAILLSFFGENESAPEPLPAPSPGEIRGGYELFPHQRTAVRGASSLASSPPYRLLIHMPTGSGKTRTAMSLIADHLRQHEPAFVLWLAAGEELCDQAVDEFQSAWGKLGNRPMPLLRWWGGSTVLPPEIPFDGFAVAGLAKIYSRGIADIPWLARLGDKTSMIVFDEAHQSIAPTYRHVVEAVAARNPLLRLIGLSATPGRTWNDVTADEELSDFFGRRKVTLEIPGFSNPIDYLIEERYLAKPTFRTIESSRAATERG